MGEEIARLRLSNYSNLPRRHCRASLVFHHNFMIFPVLLYRALALIATIVGVPEEHYMSDPRSFCTSGSGLVCHGEIAESSQLGRSVC